jgi:hypothetical protein
MGQISVKIYATPGSLLIGNQQGDNIPESGGAIIPESRGGFVGISTRSEDAHNSSVVSIDALDIHDLPCMVSH